MSFSTISNTIELSGRKLRTVLAFGLVTLVGVGASLGGAEPASAPIYWSTGQTGPSSTPRGICWLHTSWNRLDVSTIPPTVYARNNVAGAGNDWQWVRFRTFLVDGTGRTVASNGWSEWQRAYDNSPARFGSAQTFTNVMNYSRIDVRIEWWNSTAMLGAVADRITLYNYYTGGFGPIGPLDSCAK